MSHQPRPGANAAASISLFLFGLLVLVPAFAGPGVARATAPDETRLARPQDADSGRLFFRSDDGQGFTPAPLVHTDVRIAVSGMVARTSVSQRFHNPGTGWVEGVYVFPLPQGAAVDRLRLQIGDRTVLGRIEERQQAQRSYQAARAQGQRAGLVEQERPNVFTASVANIGPDEAVVVEIEFQDSPRYDQGQFALRFPLVVAPRYIPGQGAVVAARGWAPATGEVPDAPRITPPVRNPSIDGVGNPVSLRVEIDAGLPLAEVKSVTHAIDLADGGQGRVIATLASPNVPADRDFVITWRPNVGAAPEAGVFVEQRDGRRHLLVMLMPPAVPTEAIAAPPREAIFILDTSGSMEGASIRQAKAALKLALDRLTPNDSFNVIEFNSQASSLFARPQPADARAVARAHGFVDGLRANGGTAMLSALTLALDGAERPERLRQIVFLTDGAVGNEDAVFRFIRERLGGSRLFTVGIGAAPNGWFMNRAAEAGRGTFTNVDRVEDVGARMAALFAKLEKPVLTDVAVTWPTGAQVERYPNPVPDLYAGEPVVLVARLDGDFPAGGAVEITGRAAGRTWRRSVALDRGDDRAGVAALWARRKLAQLDATRHDGASAEDVRAASLQVALAYGLVSRYTSLVAVDATPARPQTAPLETREVPTNLPAGWSYDAVFGRQPDAPAQRLRHAQSGAAPATAPPPATMLAEQSAYAAPLPQTATAAELRVLLGALALLLALVLLVREARNARR